MATPPASGDLGVLACPAHDLPDALVVVDDGTGTLDIWCPARTSPWGPVIRRRYEFEVRVERPVPHLETFNSVHRELQEQASAGRLKAAREAAERLVPDLQRKDRAIATDIRPLD